MTQPIRTANDIIVKAYRGIGILSPDELPTGAQIEDGLYFLNDALLRLTKCGTTIPLMQIVRFDITAGKDTYTISDEVPADVNFKKLIYMNTCRIIVSSNSYPVSEIKENQLYGTAYNEDVQAIPRSVIVNKENLQTTLKFYPAPPENYECEISGKFAIEQIQRFSNFTALPPEYEPDLTSYLKVKLSGSYPAAFVPDWVQEEYRKFNSEISKGSKKDLTLKSSSILSRGYGQYYNINYYG